MLVQVRPQQLDSAAQTLHAQATWLATRQALWRDSVAADLPAVGKSAAAAADQAVEAADEATTVIVNGLRAIATALHALSAFYPQLDDNIVTAPGGSP